MGEPASPAAALSGLWSFTAPSSRVEEPLERRLEVTEARLADIFNSATASPGR